MGWHGFQQRTAHPRSFKWQAIHGAVVQVGRHAVSFVSLCHPNPMYVRVRLKIIRNLKTMHDPDLHAVLMRTLRIIFKRIRIIAANVFMRMDRTIRHVSCAPVVALDLLV